MDRTGQIFEGRYRLRRLLGQGGMAEVYAGLDLRLDKAVAVKVMTGERAAGSRVAARFVQEARAASQIRHPNVIDITDFGVADDGVAYLVMEHLRGEDLAATVAREGPLPWTRVGPIALQICAALAAAHRVGVIHRDIKPSNCFRVHAPGNPDFIKVLDFGIARVLDPDRRVAEPTTAGTLLGTPEYMAPEVAAGGEAGPPADLYAVAALMYRLLTGAPPFTGDSFQAVLSKQIFEPPISPRRRAPGRDIPGPADALILRALAKDPAERPADMVALAAAIADALPERPAVELWIDPAVGEPTRSMVAPCASGPEPITVAHAPSRPATVPISGETPARPRRGKRVWIGAGFGLAGVALAATLWGPLAAPVEPAGGDRERGAVEPEGPERVERGAVPGDSSQASAPSAASDPGHASGAAGPSSREGAVPWDLFERAEAPVTPSSTGASPPAAPAPASSAVESDVPDSPAAGTSREAVQGAASPGVGRAPARARRPGFDEDAARRAIQPYVREVQRCALAADMLRGDIRLVFTVDIEGRVSAVEAAPGSRRVEATALACVRRELAALRLAPGPGAVAVDFTV